MTFGEKLKSARIDSGLKQAELAKKLNTTGNTISNWENNVSKPDLDMLSYICGALHVTASYFLQPTIPEDEISLIELNMVKKYRALDDHGKEMVNFTLEKEYERSIEIQKQSNIITLKEPEPDYLAVNAAREDENSTAEDREADNAIMADDSEWE